MRKIYATLDDKFYFNLTYKSNIKCVKFLIIEKFASD